jgi:hypothetical protein
VVPVDRRGKRVESLERKSVRLLITHNQAVVGIGTEVFDALLKSRLASASAVEWASVPKARPTSPSPAVKVSPFATKPATGMSARTGAHGE